MKIETDNLITVSKFAINNGFTTSYIYRLVREKKINVIVIDGVKFIDKVKYPTLPK